jgi:predicted DNA-binding transcriptional regulator AlpA
MALVSINKAAQLAGVSRQHLYKMAADGKISVDKSAYSGERDHSFRRT